MSSLKERVVQAVGWIKEAHRDGDVLVQIWVPTRKENQQVLTTYGQPFSLNPSCQRLLDYRTISTSYQFSAEENSDEVLGLPGRVFIGKLPEWSPDVRYFSSHEYARVNYAQHFDVRGTLALPIFERGSRPCIGVLEVVMTTEKINYRSDLDSICNALQAVDLRSSEVPTVPRIKMKIESYVAAMPEISAVLRAVCQTHGLPLAQTWVPCVQQGKSGSRHSDQNYRGCVSTVDGACFVNDSSLFAFHEACSEHHLLRGQGVVGKAFTTNQPCFSSDVSAYSKTEYPLSHYARMFRLRAAVAIRLRGVNSGNCDFVLEFFLPMECHEGEEQKVILHSLSTTMRQVCRSFRVLTEKELQDETTLQVNEQLASNMLCGARFGFHEGQNMSLGILTPAAEVPEPDPTCTEDLVESLLNNNKANVLRAGSSLQFEDPELKRFSGTSFFGRPDAELLTESSKPSADRNQGPGGDITGKSDVSSKGKAAEKKRTKMEKTISMEVLQQHFSGSLKDAAKSIGVCPTTLKRICRQHGISRWPSRKIKKVGHSLRKLQVVIDSIQGVDSAYHLSSLYSDFPKAGAPDQNAQRDPGRSSEKHDEPPASLSNSPSSSCSHSSSSSQSCSHRTQAPIKEEEQEGFPEENQREMLKRVHSEAQLRLPPRRKTLVQQGLGRSTESEGHPREGEDQTQAATRVEFKDLKQEIARRFGIVRSSSMELKYLDDDSEWVLMTCDADLHECGDIHRSSGIPTIKISVQHPARPRPAAARRRRHLSDERILTIYCRPQIRSFLSSPSSLPFSFSSFLH
ncbi:unnamed protein product [Spirodela intermedia]|uniref:RWP-RK domain-containing protein n=1 Tax=Spirodela intermedia TaxID=51605 RepID=A0A7I8J8V4_SPIIN|nr:unnamed protein product [Spirodela intermedia]CAA6666658.1 unnamed protein product [Spirodela intermedia]